MRITMAIVTSLALAVAGCGANIPPPNAEFAQAQQDLGRAQESGSAVPDAQLHMRLAQENLDAAKALMGTTSKDNERAAQLIARASAEAELALNIARDTHARADLAQAQAQLAKSGGAIPPSSSTPTTTTTGATLPKKNP